MESMSENDRPYGLYQEERMEQNLLTTMNNSNMGCQLWQPHVIRETNLIKKTYSTFLLLVSSTYNQEPVAEFPIVIDAEIYQWQKDFLLYR